MTDLALITGCFPDLEVAHELVRGLSAGVPLLAVENAAHGWVTIADVHEASTPNAYRSPR